MNVHISGGEGEQLQIFDINGRVIMSGTNHSGNAFAMPSTGVYLVKIGNRPAKKVMVLR